MGRRRKPVISSPRKNSFGGKREAIREKKGGVLVVRKGPLLRFPEGDD